LGAGAGHVGGVEAPSSCSPAAAAAAAAAHSPGAAPSSSATGWMNWPRGPRCRAVGDPGIVPLH